jgi:hypothetical protein
MPMATEVSLRLVGALYILVLAVRVLIVCMYCMYCT